MRYASSKESMHFGGVSLYNERMRWTGSRAVLLAIVISGCGADRDQRAFDAALPDAVGAPVMRPTWMLEDVQPQSPRTGQTYGLDTFGSKVVVVTLVEGY
jgi:hypothetical protein